jgi:hypothetical protein
VPRLNPNAVPCLNPNQVAERDALSKANQYQDIAKFASRDQPPGDTGANRHMSDIVQSIRTIDGRVATFGRGWPHVHHTNLTVRELAVAGFFFTPSAKCPDRVTCAYCGLELGEWNSDANVAWEAHAAGNPACAFLSRLVTDIDVTSTNPMRNVIPTGERGEGKRSTEPPMLRHAVWLVENYVDFPDSPATVVQVLNESVSHDVKIEGCQGESKRRQVTVHCQGAPPVGEAIRSLLISNSSYVRVNVDRIITKMVVVNCSYIEIVIGGHPPNITVKNTTGCTITLCPEFMDHEIESLNAAGVALQAVPRDAISPLQVRALGCA